MKRWFAMVLPVLILASLIVWRLEQKKIEVQGQMQQRAAKMKGPLEQKKIEVQGQMQQRAAKMKGPALVSLAPVQIRDITHVFEATGSVEAPLSVKIAPKITGRIEFLQVREGDRVKKGQVLARIDSSQVEADVQQAMASVAEAQYRLAQAQMSQNPNDVAVNTQIRQQHATVASADADYTQSVQTTEAQVLSAQAGVIDAQSKIDNAKAAVNSAKANLDNAKTKYDRIFGLYKKGFVAAQDVDDAKATVTVQESAVEVAQGLIRSANAQYDAAQQQLNIAKAKGKADVKASSAKLTQARASLEYAQSNTSQKSAYRQSIAALKASLAAAQAGLRSAQAKRGDTVLISPLDGYVTSRSADPGAIASPTQPIVSVQFIKQVWVTLSVPQDVCSNIHIGQPAQLSFDNFPGRKFTASIIQINPSADPDSRQFTVRVILSNSGGLFKPGMFGHVSIETERIRSAVSVPREAIQKSREGTVVVVVGPDHKAKRVPVTTLAEDEKYISIGGDIRPGQQVVTMSTMPVKDGQTIIAGGKGMHGKGRPGGGSKEQ